MGRKKVRLECIKNENAGRVTYKKRVKGIVKKTQELSVLCGVDACAIVYGPYDRAPVVWPDQSQRRFTQETYLKQSFTKAQERLEKLQRRNREMEIEHLMIIDLLARKPLEQVSFTDKLRCIQHRIGVLEGVNNAPNGNVNSSTIASANANAEGGIMQGINNVMMEAGPSQLPPRFGIGNGWHLG